MNTLFQGERLSFVLLRHMQRRCYLLKKAGKSISNINPQRRN
jgi:hypothetical protein